MRLSWAIGLMGLATSYLAQAAVPVELIQATAASLGLQVQTLSDVHAFQRYSKNSGTVSVAINSATLNAQGAGALAEIRTELGAAHGMVATLTIPALAASNATNGLLYGRLALRDIALLPNGNTVQALVRLEANPSYGIRYRISEVDSAGNEVGQILDTRLGDSGLDYWLPGQSLTLGVARVGDEVVFFSEKPYATLSRIRLLDLDFSPTLRASVSAYSELAGDGVVVNVSDIELLY